MGEGPKDPSHGRDIPRARGVGVEEHLCEGDHAEGHDVVDEAGHDTPRLESGDGVPDHSRHVTDRLLDHADLVGVALKVVQEYREHEAVTGVECIPVRILQGDAETAV